MPDPSRLEKELLGHFPEAWVRQHLNAFPPAYFAAFDAEEVVRDLERIRTLDEGHLVDTRAWPADPDDDDSEAGAGGERWWVEVVGYDAFQFLSTLCNLLAVHGFSIVEGRVFTSQPPPASASTAGTSGHAARRPIPRIGAGVAAGGRPWRGRERLPDRRPKVVDRFLVRRDGPGVAGPPDWDAFREELATLTRLLRDGQHEEVHHRLIRRVAAALRRQRGEGAAPVLELEPLDLAIDPDADDAATVVRVAARDSFGFLSLTASALALCGIRIAQADIRTGGSGVDDTLRVTDRAGHKIVDEATLRQLRLSLILIEHFSTRLQHATDPEAALVHFSRFANETMARPAWAEEFAVLDRPEVLDALVRVLGESDFLWEDFLHARPEDLLPLVCDPAEWRRRGPAELSAELDAATAGLTAGDPPAVAEALRRFKDRAIFRAGFRAILAADEERGPDPDALAEELSDAAGVLLGGAYRLALEEMGDALPRTVDGRPVPSALFALGKCGGRELGFGSDLELMLVYDDVAAAEPAVAAFDALVAALRRLLAGRKGSTFDLDFRLRPYGRAGTPATSLSAFADYYRGDGPAWGYERQALIKLRGVAGDPALIAGVGALRDRFVYGPEPFDLEGCRRLRRLQVEQPVRPGRINAKFSPGALVDVEYLVQALQIAHGGRDPRLRAPDTLGALSALADAGRLGPDRAATLRDCYRFFRALIDALRVVRGHAQDLTVPPADSDDFAMLARRLRRDAPDALRAEIDRCLGEVQALSSRLEELLRADP